MCRWLRAAGYDLLVTTAALAWHLYAPGGGSRTVEKTATGVHVTSGDGELQLDEALFRKRLAALKRDGLSDRPLRRYRRKSDHSPAGELRNSNNGLTGC